MKVQVDGIEIFELNESEKNILKNDLISETLHSDCCRRLKWVLKHKIEQCYRKFEEEWLKKLREDPSVTSIPTSKEKFVEFVLSRPDYHNRSERIEIDRLKKIS